MKKNRAVAQRKRFTNRKTKKLIVGQVVQQLTQIRYETPNWRSLQDDLIAKKVSQHKGYDLR